MKKDKIVFIEPTTASYGIGAAIAILENTILAIYRERNPDFDAFLARITGNHWVTHGILIIGFYILISRAIRWTIHPRTSTEKGIALAIVISALVSIMTLAVFFMYN